MTSSTGSVVKFYYSLGSRYSYLASTQIQSIENGTGYRFEWQPLNSVELIRRKEGPSPFEGEPVSGQYTWNYRERDAKRWAAHYGVPYIEPRGRVDFSSDEVALAATVAKRLGYVRAFSRELFDAIFAEPAETIGP